jgi:hypothetical protein
VNYAIQFSGPMTASPPAAFGMASNPTSSASPGPSPGIKTRSSPAAFPATLYLPFVPSLFTFLHHPLVPQAAPSLLTPCGPPSPQHRYDAASGNNAAARPAGSYSVDASAALPRQPSDPCIDPCIVTLMKRPAFQQVASDLVI